MFKLRTFNNIFFASGRVGRGRIDKAVFVCCFTVFLYFLPVLCVYVALLFAGSKGRDKEFLPQEEPADRLSVVPAPMASVMIEIDIWKGGVKLTSRSLDAPMSASQVKEALERADTSWLGELVKSEDTRRMYIDEDDVPPGLYYLIVHGRPGLPLIHF